MELTEWATILDIQANMIQCFVEAQGMIAENMQREHLGESMAFIKDDFDKLIEKHGVHWNYIGTRLYGR